MQARSRRHAAAEEPLVLGLHRAVAFAGNPDQAVEVGYFDMPAAVMDEVRLLQCAGHKGNAVAAGADHLRDRLLGKHQLVAAGQVARLQQAPR